MRDRIRQLVFVMVLVLPLAAVAQPVDLPDTRPRADDEQLRHALERVRQQHGVPGLAAAVFDREQVRTFGLGELTPGGKQVTQESRFRVGQVSLLFTGLATAALVADGSIPPSAQLARLAPEIDLQNPWSGERPVRIDDLLAHRAGLGATHFRDVYGDSDAQPLLAGINSAFRALRLQYPPGDREHYSIVGPAIAAYLVEKAADMRYEDVLARMLFDPLEAGATLGRPQGARSTDSAGHAESPARQVPARPLTFPPAGDLWISAHDLARTGKLLLNRGLDDEQLVIPEQAVNWMESLPEGMSALVPGSRRGVHAEEFNGFLFYTQSGALPGFQARFAYSRELGRGYLVLLNRGDADAALAEADALLRGQLLGGDERPAAVEAAAGGGAGVSELAGWYRNVTPAHPPQALYQSITGFARASACESVLCFSSPGLSRILAPFDDGRLREQGRWRPGWQWRETETGKELATAAARWQRVPGWEVHSTIIVTVLVAGGLVLGAVLLPVWSWQLVRRRTVDYHELVPRLLPLAAVVCVLALQVLLFVTGYPALGELAASTVAILVLSVLAPVLGVLALVAALAGIAWQLPRRAVATTLFLALSANGAVVAMALHDLVAFQAWNY